jgi:16S rRNA A1518/A1519 N6-dimethyltransferase RsmA/KsgA/DIM1 with predicted DNA glycosylase/AP lyase activity
MNSQTKKDIRKITDLIDIENKSVIELGCGDGRITFELTDMVQEIAVRQ